MKNNWQVLAMKALFTAMAKSPKWMQRFCSSVLYYLLYYVSGYRKKVVQNNLQRCYPDKTLSEIKSIEKKFYRYLSELIPEALAVHEMSPEQILNNTTLQGAELLEEQTRQGKNVIIVAGHLCNWELCGQATVLRFPGQVKTLYMPLKNKAAEYYFRKQRERFGLETISAKESGVLLPKIFSEQKGKIVAFIADQSPNPQRAYWINFLNRPTGFFKGFELYARQFELPVFYIHLERERDGTYLVRFEPLVMDSLAENEGIPTLKFARKLEEQIYECPEHWLWSHKRWKHAMPDNQTLIHYD